MSTARRYVMAVKFLTEPPVDWCERLARIPGVSVTGSTATRAQFVATAEAAARVEAEFAEHFRIEEAAERKPAE